MTEDPAARAPRPMSAGLFQLCLWFGLLGAFTSVMYVERPAWGRFLDDFTLHLQFAAQLAAGNAVVPHTGLHWILLATSWLTGLELRHSIVLVIGVASAVSAGLVYRLIEALAPHGKHQATLWATIFASLSSSLVVMAMVPNWYIGQGSPNLWHSPTWMLAQPFGLWALLQFARERLDAKHMALAGALLAISATIKPNFAIAFLPAAWLWMLVRRRDLLASLPNLALSLPACAVLAYQLTREYLSPGSDDGLLVAPFAVWRQLSPCIPCSILLAIAFPLLVFLARRRQSIRDDFGLLAALLLAIAFLQYALLAESGARFLHANWMWGYNYALKVAFVVAAAWIVRPETPPWLQRTGWMLLGLHALFGVRHLIRAMSGLGMQ